MKYALILPDGAADEPVEMLGGRTPLEMANIPNIDWVSINGRQGRVRTVPRSFSPGSDVCTMSLMGYDPAKDYTGRAPLEAAAQNITVAGDDLVFRCNLVTIMQDVMEDFTAGHISSSEAATLIADLDRRVAGVGAKFHSGVSYRHLVVLKDAGDVDCTCTPPHDILGKKVQPYLPKGAGVNRVRELMERAALVLPRDLKVGGPAQDELYPGRHRLDLEFFLPRGSYATLLLKRMEAVPLAAEA